MLMLDEDPGEICCSPIHGSGGQPQAGSVVLTDALGNTWCADCRHRGELLNWGKAHGWPAVEIEPYALAEGAYFWNITAILGEETRVWMFVGLIEMLDEAEKGREELKAG